MQWRVLKLNIKYGYLDPNLLQMYNSLDFRRKRYIDFRGQGYNKTESYKMAGYNVKNNIGQAAYQLDNNPKIKPILDAIFTHNKLDEFGKGDGTLKNQIDAISSSSQAKKALKVLENATGEEAQRINFYLNIANGKTKTIEKTTVKDKDGNIKEERIVEKEPTIADRMTARQRLDNILGLNDVPSVVGTINAGGGITVTIVDASNKDQKQDKRNDVVIDADFTETTKSDNEEVSEDEE